MGGTTIRQLGQPWRNGRFGSTLCYPAIAAQPTKQTAIAEIKAIIIVIDIGRGFVRVRRTATTGHAIIGNAIAIVASVCASSMQ